MHKECTVGRVCAGRLGSYGDRLDSLFTGLQKIPQIPDYFIIIICQRVGF